MDFTPFKILAQKHALNLWQRVPKKPLMGVGILFVLPVFGVLTAFGIAPDTALEKIERRNIVQELALPATESSIDLADTFKTIDRVQRGDTLAALLSRLNISDYAAFQFLRSEPSAKSIFQLRPGRTVHALAGGQGELINLKYLYSPDKFLEVNRMPNGGFIAREGTFQPNVQTVHKTGTIKSSLFAATDSTNIPDAIASQIARIFSTDIDFHIDLRKDDRFAVVYEMHYDKGEYIKPGRVLSAEFVNNGKRFDAILYIDAEGNEAYYSADGQNRAKSFLRSPLEFSRISSTFGSRLHPIFKNWRQHTGVDFAAPRGTRVWATADGTVEYAGVKGGYGNVLEIRHNAGITTLYGHLSSFAKGISKGTRVRQGEVIAFVGATGWATGPHLHYEFKVSGIHHDPLHVALPKAEPLPEHQRSQFQKVATMQTARLALVRNGQFDRFE